MKRRLRFALLFSVGTFVYGGLFATSAFSNNPESAQTSAFKTIREIKQLEPNLPDVEVPMRALPLFSEGKKLNLQEAIEIGIANNSGMRTARENIQSLALNLVAIRRGYYPQLRAITTGGTREAGITYENLRSSEQYLDSSQTIGFTQKMPFGGSLSLDVGGQYGRAGSGPGDYSPRATLSMTQPLLRGAGRDLQQEPLIAARRQVLYALRDYKLQLEDFCISVTDGFLTLQNLKQKIATVRAKLAALEHLTRRSEYLYQLGRESEIEVMRAKEEVLQTQLSLQNLEIELKNRKELFAILLNLPPQAPLELEEFQIPFQPLEENPEALVEIALMTRPDLRNAADTVEDNRRSLKFAKRNNLPDLDVNVSANAVHSGVQTGNLIREDYYAGFTLSLPLERTKERVAEFGTWLQLQQNERAYELTRSTIASALRYHLSRLKVLEEGVEIQKQIVESSAKKLRIAEFRFERGDASNRSIIEANTSHANAMNAWHDLLQQHFIATLKIERDLGRLSPDSFTGPCLALKASQPTP